MYKKNVINGTDMTIKLITPPIFYYTMTDVCLLQQPMMMHEYSCMFKQKNMSQEKICNNDAKINSFGVASCDMFCFLSNKRRISDRYISFFFVYFNYL